MGLSVTRSSSYYHSYSSSDNRIHRTPGFIVRSLPVDAHCIIQHRSLSVGDVLTYKYHECMRIGDSATGSFTLDENGVPTITGSNGSMGFDFGVYDCTVTYNLVEEDVPVTHNSDASIRATFNFGTQDAEGYTVFTPSSDTRLLYVDPTLGSDSTQGPTGNNTDYYLGSSPPGGDWENPGSINAFSTVAAAMSALRDGFPDWILLKRGETYSISSSLDFTNLAGRSASERMMVIAYGTGNRPHLNPTAIDGSSRKVIHFWVQPYLGVSGIQIYPTYRDPDHGDFAGWGNTAGTSAIGIYTGGGPDPSYKGYIIEDCDINFSAGGVSLTGSGGITDCIIRRNVIRNTYSEESTAQGISAGDLGTWEVYIGDNVLDHCGWVKQNIDQTETATSGNTTSLTRTGAGWAVGQWDNISLQDLTNLGYARATSNTSDTINFTVYSGTVDFTGGGDYRLGYSSDGRDESQGQATTTNHNMYLRDFQGAIVENNITANSSSLAIKLTSQPTNATEQAAGICQCEDFIESNNLVISCEDGMGGGGNFSNNNGPRFRRMRVTDNVQIDQGENNSTGRSVALGMLVGEWAQSLMGNNIVLNTDGVTMQTYYGIRVAGYTSDTMIVRNQIIDVGRATGTPASSLTGLIYFDTTNEDYDNIIIARNDFQNKATDGQCVGEYETVYNANMTWADNRYYTDRASGEFCRINASNDTYANFIAQTGETGSSNTEIITYQNYGANIEGYQTSRGGTATVAAFIAEAVGQEKGSYDKTLEAKAVVAYFKSAFME